MKTFEQNASWEDVAWRSSFGPNEEPCIFCGRPVTIDDETRWVHLVEGGAKLATVDESTTYEGTRDSLGLHPVGSDCAKRAGTPYIHRIRLKEEEEL